MRVLVLESRRAQELGECDLLILLTGVGTRAMAEAVERVRGRSDGFIDVLRSTRIAARGPKSVAVLREWGVPVWLIAPEPNTWRELIATLDERIGERPLAGARVFVQE